MRLLLASPSPRDIEDFHDAIIKMPHDIYMAKYYPQLEAYIRIRNFFLKHSEYDVLCLVPDDLVMNQKSLDILINDIKRHPEASISGYCNFDMASYKHRFNFRREGSFDYPEESNFEEYMSKARLVYPPSLYAVDFVGFGCTLIPRKVVEKIPFVERPNHAAIDAMFSENCQKKGIDVLVDTRARFLHLAFRVRYGVLENIKVGQKKPEELFMPLA